MKILFLHGWHSIVGGVKPTYLKDHGHEVLNPVLDDDNFAEAVRTAQAEFDEQRPEVVVGSSRGGAIVMNIESGNTPLVLLCPAWKNWGTVANLKPNSTVLHSRSPTMQRPHHPRISVTSRSCSKLRLGMASRSKCRNIRG